MHDESPPAKPEREAHENAASDESLEAVWSAIEEGRIEEALDIADTLAREHPTDGEVRLAHAAAAFEAGDGEAALDAARKAGELGVEDRQMQRWYVAAALFQLWKLSEARDLLQEIVRDDAQFPDAWYLLAQTCETLGDEIGTRRGYDRAFELEPDRFARPVRIEGKALDRVIERARADLPREFRRALDDVPVIVQPLPTFEMAQAAGESEPLLPPDLLGLFVGRSQLDRSVFNPVDQPGVIFLFQTNLERVCLDEGSLEEEVRTTLYHELAHYLGFEEEDMHDLGLE